MEVLRLVFRALLVVVALGLIFEFFVPGGARYVDIATAVFAAALWAVSALILVRWNIWPPRTSLGSAGMSISFFAYALTLSLMTIALAVLDFIFTRGGDWAWRSLLAIAAFWICGTAVMWIGIKFGKPVARPGPPGPTS